MEHQYTDLILRNYYVDENGEEVVQEQAFRLKTFTIAQHRPVEIVRDVHGAPIGFEPTGTNTL